MKLAVVTATVDSLRAAPCLESWGDVPLVIVEQGRGPSWKGREGIYRLVSTEILGVVPAFARGVQVALRGGADIVACLHDDLEIHDPGWAHVVQAMFQLNSTIGLVGFGGATGLADHDIYRKPYDPMQLARKNFMSNMRDAEAHGVRVTEARQVACLDGFSQIGRRGYWEGCTPPDAKGFEESEYPDGTNLFQVMQDWGIVHHAYDAALGCFANRLRWQTWMLPIPCHHHGGLTAVADPRYHEWAAHYSYEDLERPEKGVAEGDAGFWEKSHRVVYETFRDVLPIRVVI